MGLPDSAREFDGCGVVWEYLSTQPVTLAVGNSLRCVVPTVRSAFYLLRYFYTGPLLPSRGVFKIEFGVWVCCDITNVTEIWKIDFSMFKNALKTLKNWYPLSLLHRQEILKTKDSVVNVYLITTYTLYCVTSVTCITCVICDTFVTWGVINTRYLMKKEWEDRVNVMY